MSTFLIILLGVVVLFVILIYTYVRKIPVAYHVYRSRVLNAPLEKVYPLIVDLKKWEDWSPWIEEEPEAKLLYSEDTSSEGAWHEWEGKKIGSGKMTIVKVTDKERIDSKIEFFKPWKSKADIYTSLAQVDGNKTKITWGMRGKNSLFARLFFSFIKMKMDDMIGRDYERGFDKLEWILDSTATKYTLDDDGIVDIPSKQYLCIEKTSTLEDMGKNMKEAFSTLMTHFEDNSYKIAGFPISIYDSMNMIDNKTKFRACIPFEGEITSTAEMKPYTMPATKAYQTTLTGNYDKLGIAWGKAMMRVRNNGHKMSRKLKPFEIYPNNPNEVAPNDTITNICIPVK